VFCKLLLRHYGGGDAAEADSDAGAMATNVEESLETLPDGTVVKRRVVTTTQQELTTERVVLEPDDDWNNSQVLDDTEQQPVFDFSHDGLCYLFYYNIIHTTSIIVLNKKLSYCWETVRRESMPRIAEMDVEMTT